MSSLATRSLALGASVALIVAATYCAAPDTQQKSAAITVASVPAARFADPDRRAKLMGAMPAIDSLFRNFATRSHVPGIAYGILIDGELVHMGTAGMRDIAAKSPVDSATVFRIASMTKSFTALAILKLRDEGKLSLDDAAEKFIPELAGLGYPTADSPRLTIRHLLSHAEGFPEDNPWGDRQLDRTDAEMAQMMKSGIPFSNPPGIAYEYSNYGFAILGRIVARVSGMSYSDYVSANIFKPLGLNATTLHAAAVPAQNLAHGYRWEDGQWKDEPLLPDGSFGPMGGMMTSITDLGRYVGFLMSAWPPRDDADNGPVRRASMRAMQTVARPRPAQITRSAGDNAVQLYSGGYGYGLGISQSCAFGHIVAHSGGLPGFGSQMRWLPQHGVGIIALGNLTYTGWGGVITEALNTLSRTGGLEPRTPQPSPELVRARDAVSRLIMSWNDPLADSVAAMNLFLDDSLARRHRHIDSLRAQAGDCQIGNDFQVENSLRGTWRMPCSRGALDVAITLAPTVPPKVQYLDVQLGDPGRPRAPVSACPKG